MPRGAATPAPPAPAAGDPPPRRPRPPPPHPDAPPFRSAERGDPGALTSPGGPRILRPFH